MFVLLHELKVRKKSFIIWTICLILLVVSMFSKADVYVAEPSLAAVFNTFPKSIMALFGMSGYDLTTYSGFYAVGFVYFVIATCVYTISIVSSLFNDDITSSTAEYTYTKPMLRNKVFSYKLIAGLLLVTFINLIILSVGVAYSVSLQVDGLVQDVLLIHLNIYLINLIFYGLVLLLIGLMRSTKGVYGITISLLMLTYFIDVIYNSFDNVDWLFYLSPFSFLPPLLIFNQELNYLLFVGVFIFFILSSLLCYYSYKEFEY